MSIHQQAASHLLERLMKDRIYAKTISRWATDFATKEVPASKVAHLGQMPWNQGFPLEEVACLVYMHANTMAGNYVWQTYMLSKDAEHDKHREANQRTLDELPGSVVATVDPDQGTDSGGDGYAAWTRVEPFWRCTGKVRRDGSPVVIGTKLDPCEFVPLEIGTTLPSKTLHHLATYGRKLARFPYHVNAMQILGQRGPALVGGL